MENFTMTSTRARRSTGRDIETESCDQKMMVDEMSFMHVEIECLTKSLAYSRMEETKWYNAETELTKRMRSEGDVLPNESDKIEERKLMEELAVAKCRMSVALERSGVCRTAHTTISQEMKRSDDGEAENDVKNKETANMKRTVTDLASKSQQKILDTKRLSHTVPLSSKIYTRSMTRKTRVLLIGIDGVRPDALLFAHPTFLLSSISTASSYSFHMDCGDIPVSGPSWATLLTGKSRHLHGVLDNEFKSSEESTMFSAIEDSMMFASSWDGMVRLCGNDVTEYKFYGTHKDTRLNDAETIAGACEYLRRETVSAAVYVYLNDVDHSGHEHGFGPHVEKYIDAIRTSDDHLKRLSEAIQRRRDTHDERWVVICVTDHGGTDRACMSASLQHDFDACTCGQEHYTGVHGLDMSPHRQTFLYVAGDGIEHGEILPPPLNTDVSALVKDILLV